MSVAKTIVNPINKKAYKLLKPLGQGTVGRVFLGEDPDKNLVAVKMITPMFSKLGTNDAVDAEYECLKAVKESQILGCSNYLCLVDYFIVEVKDTFYAFIITEYNPDLEELDQYLQMKKTISKDEYQEIKSQLFKIVGKLHEAGITHNDLNMGNVMIDRKTKILKLIDFGTCDHGLSTSSEDDFEKDKMDLEEMDDILQSYLVGTQNSKRMKSEK